MVENEVVNRAIDYIFAHIDEKITIEDVAAYCNYSKFHFSRLFKEEMGESLYSFIKRNRLICSAVAIKAEKEKSITEIGMDYGYSSSNYATAFRELTKKSPVRYRQAWQKKEEIHVPLFGAGIQRLKSFGEYDEKITITELPEWWVYYQRFLGSYEELRIHWETFIREHQPYVTADTLWIERSLSDPELTKDAQCICDVCMTVPEDSPLRPLRRLSGGRYAVYHFEDQRDQIYSTYQGLFAVWLPESPYHRVWHETMEENRDMFDVIRNFDGETGIMKLDICIPVLS